MREQDKRLVDASCGVLGPAAQLGPYRRDHAGVAADPAKNAADKPDRAICRPASESYLRQSRRQQGVSPIDREEYAKRNFESAAVELRQRKHAKGDTDDGTDDERKQSPRFDRTADRPHQGDVQQRPAGDRQGGGLQGLQSVQPDRRRHQRKRKAGAAGGQRAKERARPYDRQCLHGKGDHHTIPLRRKSSPTVTEQATQTDTTIAPRSRTAKNSIASTLMPNAMCRPSAVTNPHSARRTNPLWVTPRKLCNESAPPRAIPSATKCIGRKIANAMPDRRCSIAARNPGLRCGLRIMSDTPQARPSRQKPAAAPRTPASQH